MKKKMRYITAFLLSLVLMLSLCSSTAYATQTTETATAPVTATGPTSASEVTPDALIDGVGWAFIHIDTETNRPADFNDYNFIVNIVNEKTGHWTFVDVLPINDYTARVQLENGDYFIGEGVVQNDVYGLFALETGQKFTLNEEIRAVDINLGFPQAGSSVTPVNPSTPGASTETPDASAELGSLTFFVDLNKTVPGTPVYVKVINEKTHDAYDVVLNASNEYKSTVQLPVGSYCIDKINSFLEGMSGYGIESVDYVVVAKDAPLEVEVLIINNNEEDSPVVEGEITPDVGQTPSGDETVNGDTNTETNTGENEVVEGEAPETPDNTGFNNIRKTLMVPAGVIFFVVVIIGLVQLKKYI